MLLYVAKHKFFAKHGCLRYVLVNTLRFTFLSQFVGSGNHKLMYQFFSQDCIRCIRKITHLCVNCVCNISGILKKVKSSKSVNCFEGISCSTLLLQTGPTSLQNYSHGTKEFMHVTFSLERHIHRYCTPVWSSYEPAGRMWFADGMARELSQN